MGPPLSAHQNRPFCVQVHSGTDPFVFLPNAMMTMKEKREDTFYLFTLVNISEDSGLNGEYENKLFRTYTQARQFMEICIKIE